MKTEYECRTRGRCKNRKQEKIKGKKGKDCHLEIKRTTKQTALGNNEQVSNDQVNKHRKNKTTSEELQSG